jgi:hypothetical protein
MGDLKRSDAAKGSRIYVAQELVEALGMDDSG